jgi:hypothetical protein
MRDLHGIVNGCVEWRLMGRDMEAGEVIEMDCEVVVLIVVA